MKKLFLILSICWLQNTVAQDNIESSKNLNNSEKLKHLPKSVQNFINKKYPNDSILKAGYKKNLWVKTYEVHYNKWIIEFDEEGNWIKNYTPDGTATLESLPDEIKKVIQKNYPKQKIVKLEQKDDNLYIYLDNNKNLLFKVK